VTAGRPRFLSAPCLLVMSAITKTTDGGDGDQEHNTSETDSHDRRSAHCRRKIKYKKDLKTKLEFCYLSTGTFFDNYSTVA
jgi:hypothetical protein